MVRLIRIVTLLVAITLLVVSVFYIDTEKELSLAHSALKAGDADQAIRHARRCFTFTSDKKVVSEAFFVAASASKSSGKYRVAKRYLDKLIKSDPNNKHALLFRGEINSAIGHYDSGITDFKHGFDLVSDNIPNSQMAYYHTKFGLVLLKSGKSDRAAEEASLALTLSPNLPDVFDLMSKIADSKGDIKRALNYCQKAYDLSLKKDKLFFTKTKGRKLSERLIQLKVKNKLSQ